MSISLQSSFSATKPHAISGGGGSGVLWGETALLDDYFVGISPRDLEDGTIRQRSVKTHSYRRYPGGPSIQRAGHSRRFNDKAGFNLSVLPGNPIQCQRRIQIFNIVRITGRQFSYVGPAYALRAYAEANVFANYLLVMASGAKFEIETAAVPNLPGS